MNKGKSTFNIPNILIILLLLIYTIGIGTIFSVTTPGIAADEIYLQQEQAYEAFLKAALE